MKKKLCALLALVLAVTLTGCSGGDSGLTLDQLAIRMALKELTAEDASRYAPVVAEMPADEFDGFVAKIMAATDKTTDWALVQTNFAHLGMEMELPEQSSEEDSEFFILQSFSVQRDALYHLYFHTYSTWYENLAMDTDRITLRFDAEKLSYVSAYSSDAIAELAGDSPCDAGEVMFDYLDRKATDPAPFDGDDRCGEVLVAVRVEPVADGVAPHSVTLNHDGGKETFEITVQDSVKLA